MNADVHRYLSLHSSTAVSSNLNHFTAQYWERTVKQKFLSLNWDNACCSFLSEPKVSVLLLLTLYCKLYFLQLSLVTSICVWMITVYVLFLKSSIGTGLIAGLISLCSIFIWIVEYAAIYAAHSTIAIKRKWKYLYR